MKQVIKETYHSFKLELDSLIKKFDDSGKQLKAARNTIKLFTLSNSETINIKSFKIPNIFNQIIYTFFRKSKAERSYEYANKLIELGVGTPEPIGYYKFNVLFLFKRSFYISKQLECDLTYRELTTDLSYPDHENILRAFVRFTNNLHEKGIHFLDHSPGNTLIKKTSSGYEFYLVDLNRMKFEFIDLKTRVANFSRLAKDKAIIKIMSDEYAKCNNLDANTTFNMMLTATNDFHYKFERKKRIKKLFKINK